MRHLKTKALQVHQYSCMGCCGCLFRSAISSSVTKAAPGPTDHGSHCLQYLHRALDHLLTLKLWPVHLHFKPGDLLLWDRCNERILSDAEGTKVLLPLFADSLKEYFADHSLVKAIAMSKE
jgi:hypothetical protein